MPTHPSRRRARLTVALMAVVVAVVAGINATAQAPAAETTCGDGVVVLGARGSGEKDSQGQGLGGPGFTAYTALINSLARKGFKQRVRAQYVRYAASDVGTLLNLDRSGPSRYFGGIDKGVANAREQLEQITSGFTASGSRCDGPRVVLVGYSQGAMVMHRLLRQLAPGGSAPNPELLNRIGGAILIADGDKQVGDTNHIYGGNTYATRGLGQQLNNRRITGTDPAPLPVSVRDRTYAVCANFDLVCDAPSPQFLAGTLSNSLGFTFGFLPRAVAGVAIHVSFYNNGLAYTSGEYGATNDLAARLVKAIPAPTTPTTPPPPTTTPPPAPSGLTSCPGGVPFGPTGYVVCDRVKRGVATDLSDETTNCIASNCDDEDTLTGEPTAAGAASLAALGLSGTPRSNPGTPGPAIELRGTPTAPPGFYPYDVVWSTKQAPGPHPATWYIEIVAR